MDLWPLLDCESSFTLLIAPPAWGKTRLLFKLYEKRRRPMVFISPLRALADEFYEAGKKQGGFCRINTISQRPSILKKFSRGTSSLLVTTPEMLSYDAIDLLAAMPTPPLFILDEFHLFYIWGGDFRPWIWEVTMGVSSLSGSVLGLTATFSDDLQTQWKNDFLRVKDSLFLIDLGNHTFKYPPSKIHFFPLFFKRHFNRFFIEELFDNKDQCFLFFCRYRHGVDAWLDFCARHRINALGCKGGEASLFILALKKNPSPRCIFATSALSHGVNLPSISKVFIDHKTKDLNFWIQMAARGGRDGAPWELYGFDPYFTSFFKKCRDVFHILWRDLISLFTIG